MSTNNEIFERSSFSKIKGFKDLNLFDDFIQTALDKFNFTSEIPKLDESAEKFHDYILNEESQIPDLIIYNKPFNKNDCYAGYYNFGFNKYPRKSFVLKAQENKNKNIKEEKEEKDDNNNKEKEEELKEKEIELKEKENELKEKERKIKNVSSISNGTTTGYSNNMNNSNSNSNNNYMNSNNNADVYNIKNI